MTFPAWYSDAEKFKALNDSATLKAGRKCQNVPYTLADVFSEPWNGLRVSIISANIVCKSAVRPVVAESITSPPQDVQKQKSITSAPIKSREINKELDQKKKCVRMGLVAGSDDYNLCVATQMR